MRIRGHWLFRWQRWEYRAGRVTHAIVQRCDPNDHHRPWRAWSMHLEGPDHCATDTEAKRTILRRLREHCERLAPLMP